MRAAGVLGSVVFFVVASLLLVSIVAPGVSAVAAFRSLPRLGVDIPAYRSYADGDPGAMGRIAAGHAIEGLFQATTTASVMLAVVAGVAWASVMLARSAIFLRPRSARASLVAMMAVIAVSALSLLEEPKLTSALERYRDLARAGDRERAREARVEFDSCHRRAERQRQAQALGTVAAIGLAALSLAGAPIHGGRPEEDRPTNGAGGAGASSPRP